MKIDRNFQQASIQLANAVRDGSAQVALCTAVALMIAGRPGDAVDSLDQAKTSIGAALDGRPVGDDAACPGGQVKIRER